MDYANDPPSKLTAGTSAVEHEGEINPMRIATSSKIIFLKVFFWFSICISAFAPLSTSRCDLCTWSFVPPPDWMEAENSAFIRISFQLFSAECFSQWSHAR